jgi:DnaK suppressor protein
VIYRVKIKTWRDKDMKKKDLVSLKKLLIQKKAELFNKVKNAQIGISDTLDNNVGDEIDAAIRSAEQEVYFELTANDKIAIEAVNNAIGKIEQDIYGKCECCGQEIAIERLMAIPWVRYCIKCQEDAERPRR